MQQKTRSCTAPAPANGGRDCSILGPSSESRNCSTTPCPSKFSLIIIENTCMLFLGFIVLTARLPFGSVF